MTYGQASPSIRVTDLHDFPTRLCLLLAAGPLLFLFAFVALSVAFAATGTPADEIAAKVAALVPHTLLAVLACLGLGLLAVSSEVQRAWQLPPGAVLFGDLAIGALCGLALALVYIAWLAPLLVWLQRTVGDYLPPGSTRPALAGSLGVFFVANVMLAPLVEETLYRGVAIPMLGERYGPVAALILSCLAFGLLHWAGGLWYMMLAGLVAGGCFAGLYHWRGGIVAPFAAHLVLNLVEFIDAAAARGDP
jgi:membrane protease YdiL (CAAX protease family)